MKSPKNILKDTGTSYSIFIWIAVIVLVFVIGALFNKYFSIKKPIVRAEHFLIPQNIKIHSNNVTPYNWNTIQATVSSDFQPQMRTGVPGAITASGDPALGCYKGFVDNLYDRNSSRCCKTVDQTDDQKYWNNCCRATDAQGNCRQWDDFSQKYNPTDGRIIDKWM